ncbi:signal recognition particle-docking protein FtsY [Murdochiella massiliensis]|uniref:signal recognition particle-docking protein FtsY n=1 Tax=Murdochiella massiliensis TaxID=1673723 RepID=UPI00082E781B|nr:signal recognition particle-docking protein FtsY [Murdochiella massiliensis]MBY0584357.1 signal recognition particle-docking protein FtsY [Murdochiella sp. Marseille-P8839]
MGFFDFLKEGLKKTRDSLGGALDNLFNGRATIDDELFDEIEEALVSADMGFETSMNVIDTLREVVAEEHIRDPQQVRLRLVEILKEKLLASNLHTALQEEAGRPMVILVIGVNGVGKTTTIGKLAAYLKGQGKSVLLAAADTFRAAAIDQLEEWSNRAGVGIVRREEGADPASVVFDGIHAAKARGVDVLICDTAGRLHNKKNLMQELEKIYRILSREYEQATLETLLVLDATTGQNAIQQARAFNEVTNITGLVLTKLDGTAKGGVVFPLQLEVKVPVKFIGVGEQMEDLRPFDAEAFVDAIFS